jgi:hypothetical protein
MLQDLGMGISGDKGNSLSTLSPSEGKHAHEGYVHASVGLIYHMMHVLFGLYVRQEYLSV